MARVARLLPCGNATFLVVLLASLFPTRLLAQVPVEQLDRMVAQQKYAEVLSLLEKSALTRAQQIAWLRAQGDAGHVPLQYELSRRLLPIDLAESLRWYAKGRLARTLDVAECRDTTSSLPGRLALDQVSEDVVKAGQANPRLFNAAILDAVRWDEERSRIPPSKWICGESVPPSAAGHVLPPDERKRKRGEARMTMASKAKFEVAREDALERGRRANYRIVDSGFPSDADSPEGSVYWLDDRRVVFLGYDVKRLLPTGEGDGKYSALNGVYLWEPEAGKIAPLFEAEKVGKLCVFKGFISFYAHLQDRTEAVLEGTLQQFHRAQFARKPHDEERYPNRSRWPRCDGLPPMGERERSVVFLLPEHGYIDFHRREWAPKAEGYHLFRPGDKVGKPLSFPGFATTPAIRYVEDRNAYMVTGAYFGPDMARDASNFPPMADRFFYWLTPDGRVKKETQPFGACTYSQGGGLPTRRGYLQHFCLMAKEGEEILAPLSARARGGIAVSPDGCKVAFGAAIDGRSIDDDRRERNAGRTGSFTLKMMNLCTGRL
jgi:hypothetical protein